MLKFGGFDTALQFAKQPDDLPPDFDTRPADVSVRNGVAIDPIQLPAAIGGEGVGYAWTVSGLPAGLSWDVDGSGSCQAARTICGTPSGADGDSTVTARVHDGDANQADSDRAELTFTITVATPTATISATSPSSLTETEAMLACAGSVCVMVARRGSPTGVPPRGIWREPAWHSWALVV